MRVSPGRVPLLRREDIGTGGDPDRHGWRATVGAFEVARGHRRQARQPPGRRRSSGELVALVEEAVAANARLLDADGVNPLAADLSLKSVQRFGPSIGKDREARHGDGRGDAVGQLYAPRFLNSEEATP